MSKFQPGDVVRFHGITATVDEVRDDGVSYLVSTENYGTSLAFESDLVLAEDTDTNS
jgi:hypothetical protein